MIDPTWTYYLILGLSILYPLAQSFEKRITMFRKFRYIFPGIIFSGILFIIWDIIFTKHEIWTFNHAYTKDTYLAGLPVEEWLFFLVVPYCIFFMYEVFRFFIKKFYFPRFSYVTIWTMIVLVLILLPFVYHKTYTFTTLLFILPFLIIQLILKTHKTWFSGFLLTYIASFIPFIIVNGFLTRLPVVSYDNAENLSIRITTIPVEDFIYLLGMILPAFTIYHLLLNQFAPKRLREKMKLDENTGF